MNQMNINLVESSDDEDIVAFVEHLGHNRRPKTVRERPNHFDNWDDHDFFCRHRLRKATVRRILNEIREVITNQTDWNSALTPEEMLLLTLRFYATGSFLNAIGDLAGVHKSTASKVIRKVSRALASLRPQYIGFPQNANLGRVKEGFFAIASFPRVIGAIDCTHVKIQSPGTENAEVYRNRKGYFSLNVQCVCDHELNIQNIVCRWPGSTHDSHIFRNSNLRNQFENGLYENSFLLGDSGYRNCSYLITPLLNPITRAENLYNEAHIRTRNTVERLFGVWKRRFPVLANGLRLQLGTIESVIVATAVLHNIACNENEEMPPADENIEVAWNDDIVPVQNYHNINKDNRARHNLITNYFNNLIN